MTLTRTSLLATLVLLTAACAGRPQVLPVNPGASIQVNQSYEAMANGSRIYFQHGQRVYKGNIDRWDTYCALYLYNRTEGADYMTSVQAGRFKVSQVGSAKEAVDNRQTERKIQLASLLRWHDHSPPSYVLFETRMELRSELQPDVRSLNCYRAFSINGPHHPKLNEMRTALGNLVEIKLNSI